MTNDERTLLQHLHRQETRWTAQAATVRQCEAAGWVVITDRLRSVIEITPTGVQALDAETTR